MSFEVLKCVKVNDFKGMIIRSLAGAFGIPEGAFMIRFEDGQKYCTGFDEEHGILRLGKDFFTEMEYFPLSKEDKKFFGIKE